MKSIDGVVLTQSPLTDLQFVNDLVDFDGPLLSHYRHPNGDDHLYYWVDCDSKMNRWLVLRVGADAIARLENATLDVLVEVITGGCLDDFVYVVDIDRDGNVCMTMTLPISKIPEDYKPKTDTATASHCADLAAMPIVLSDEQATAMNRIVETNAATPNWEIKSLPEE